VTDRIGDDPIRGRAQGQCFPVRRSRTACLRPALWRRHAPRM